MNDRDTTAFDKNPDGVDERVERLICRVIDHEASAEERAELSSLLIRDAAARALYDEYQQIGLRASTALRREVENARTAVIIRKDRRGLWLATAAGLLTMAAVVAFSFLPDIVGQRVAQAPQTRSTNPAPAFGPPIDYQEVNYMPLRRQNTLQRDVIGIPGPDPNTIYMLERARRSKRISPISGDL